MSVALIELHTVMYVPLIVHVLYSVLSILSIVLYLIKSAWAVVHVRCLDLILESYMHICSGCGSYPFRQS